MLSGDLSKEEGVLILMYSYLVYVFVCVSEFHITWHYLSVLFQ